MNPARCILTVGALLSVAAVPAVAGAAPTVSADQPCYTPGQLVRLTGSGFKANSDMSMSLTITTPEDLQRHALFSTSSDSSGGFASTIGMPDLLADQDDTESVSLNVSDHQVSATTGWKLSILDAYVDPWESQKASPRKKTTFYGYGFGTIGGSTLYAHYVLHGKLRKTVSVGGLSGPCGDIKKKQRQFPFRPVKAGTYRIKLDATKKYPNKSPGYTYKRVRVSKKQAVR
jgi:hypothetical protein